MKGIENLENPVLAQEAKTKEDPTTVQQELAQRAIKEQEAQDRLQIALAEEEKIPAVYQETLESIKGVKIGAAGETNAVETVKTKPEEAEKRKQEAEARLKARQEFVREGLQKMIDNLQSKLESKGLMGLLTPKQEVGEQIKLLRGLQAQGRSGANWERLNAYGGAGALVDKKIVKELIKETREQFKDKELEAFEGNDQIKAQIQRGMTDISAG